MMRVALILSLILLAACETPQQQCTTSATRDLQVIDRLIVETNQNIQRGYAIREEVVPRVGVNWCFGNYGYGSGISFCSGGSTSIRRSPVAIDLDAERKKLAGLQEQRQIVAARAEAQLAACAQRYGA